MLKISYVGIALLLSSPSLAQTVYGDNRPRAPLSANDVVTAIGSTKVPGIDSTAGLAAANALQFANTASVQAGQALGVANATQTTLSGTQKTMSGLQATVSSLNKSVSSMQATLATQAKTINNLTSGLAAINSSLINIGSLSYNSSTNVFSVTSTNGMKGTVTLSVATASNNTPPTISGLANTNGPDVDPVSVFASVAVADVDPSPSISALITVNDDASGTVTDANGVLSGSSIVKSGIGTYTISARGVSALNTVLQAAVFTPTAGQVTTGQTITTDFSIVATEGTGASSPGVTQTVVSGSGTPSGSGTVVGAKLNLAADGTPIIATQASTFSWANRANGGATGGGTGLLTLSQPAHNGPNQSALWSVMDSGPSCYGMLMMNPSRDFDYNSGMFVADSAGAKITYMKDLYENDHSSNIWLITETNFQNANAQYLLSNEYLGYTAGSIFYTRICKDNTNITFEVSPTGADSAWITLKTVTLSSIGNPTHVGFFADANANNSGNSYVGSHLVYYWQATAGYTPQAAAYGGDPAMNFYTNNTPGNGYPISDQAPTIPGDTPKFSALALAGGFTNVMDYTFPGSGETTITIPDDATFSKYVYLGSLEGQLTQLTGYPMDNSQGPNSAFWSHYRSYPIGDPNSLTTVTSSGLKMTSHCFGPSFARYSICGNNQVRSGFFRPPTVFRPGMTMELRYIPPTGYDSWFTWWMYSGEQKTPYPGTDPYAGNTPQGLGLSGESNGANGYNGTGVNVGSNIEIDINDNFPRNDYGGCVGANGQYGGQIDFSIPNIYGTNWPTQGNGDTVPYFQYAAAAASGSPVSYRHYNNGNRDVSSNNYWCEDAFVPGSARVLTFNWRTDNHLDLFLNGKRISTAFMSYPQAQKFNGHTLGMAMLVGGQAVANFGGNLSSVVDNDGPSATSANGDLGWTGTILSLKAWNGNIANPTGEDASTVNGSP